MVEIFLTLRAKELETGGKGIEGELKKVERGKDKISSKPCIQSQIGILIRCHVM